jgi:hypothetical protein
MYVPMSLPHSIPHGLQLDHRSLWHTSAFLSAAIESSTLPTRLRETEGMGYTLNDWQDVLSNGGRRTIAGLSFQNNLDLKFGSIDTSKSHNHYEDTEDSIQKLAMNLFPSFESNGYRGRSASQREKTFAMIESLRGDQTDIDSVTARYKTHGVDRSLVVETYALQVCVFIVTDLLLDTAHLLDSLSYPHFRRSFLGINWDKGPSICTQHWSHLHRLLDGYENCNPMLGSE